MHNDEMRMTKSTQGTKVAAAIYARYSTDEQRSESIEDQLETCRRFCVSKGWAVAGIYTDAAMSGSTSVRPEFDRLKHDAERGKFDIVVVESLDRLSRRLSDVAAFHDRLSFKGQKLFAADRGEISPLLAGILGAVAQGFLEDLKTKTKRGLRGKILAGLAAGGLGFGYRVDPTIPGGRQIDPTEAQVVRRIFTMYAAGASPRTIAATLNKDAIPGPGGRVWGDTTIRGQIDRGTGVLNNAAYVGRIEWNRCSYVRDPSTGKRVARPNPPAEWETMDAPELRIVDDELWQRVKDQQGHVRTEMARDENGTALNRAHRTKHLLSGLIICGCCGEPYAVRNSKHYGCRNHRSQGTCGNSSFVDRRALEKLVAQAMEREWLTSITIESLYAEMDAAMRLDLDGADVEEAMMVAALARVQAQINRLVSAITESGHSAALIAKLAGLENQAAVLKADITALAQANVPAPPLDPDQVALALGSIKRALPLIFDDTEDPVIADIKAMVRGMIEKIVVTPREGQPPQLTIHGRFAGLMNAAGLLEGYEEREPETTTPPAAFAKGGVLSVVAGTGFEPVTFRL